MKKNTYLIMFVFILIVLTGTMFSNIIENKKGPLKGTYQFPMEVEWNKEGPNKEEVFGLIMQIVISDSENVFLRDMKNKKYYAFDKNGKFIKSFGIKGEGPGEVKNTGGANIYNYKNTIIIRDSDKILYFNDRGNFIRSIPHLGSINFFINENEIITAPQSIQNRSNDKANMKYINLKTKQERIITNFTIFKSGVYNKGNINASAVIPSITPVMLIGLHDKKIYYGMNNVYKIHIIDLNKKQYAPFKLESSTKNVSSKEKEDYIIGIAKGIAPKEVAIRIAKTLPYKETFFQSIRSQNGMLYVYKSHFLPINYQEIDIFNSKGKYLYKSIIKVEKDCTIIAGPTFKNNFVYLALMDEEGEIFLKKYKTKLPG